MEKVGQEVWHGILLKDMSSGHFCALISVLSGNREEDCKPHKQVLWSGLGRNQGRKKLTTTCQGQSSVVCMYISWMVLAFMKGHYNCLQSVKHKRHICLYVLTFISWTNFSAPSSVISDLPSLSASLGLGLFQPHLLVLSLFWTIVRSLPLFLSQ